VKARWENHCTGAGAAPLTFGTGESMIPDWSITNAASTLYVSPRTKVSPGDYCNRCGHVHQGGVEMGGGGFCPCQLEGVPR
jgi:hypothetical protein